MNAATRTRTRTQSAYDRLIRASEIEASNTSAAGVSESSFSGRFYSAAGDVAAIPKAAIPKAGSPEAKAKIAEIAEAEALAYDRHESSFDYMRWIHLAGLGWNLLAAFIVGSVRVYREQRSAGTGAFLLAVVMAFTPIVYLGLTIWKLLVRKLEKLRAKLASSAESGSRAIKKRP